MAENTINDFNTLPEQVQLNKKDIKKLSEQIQSLITNIANLRWELNTDDIGNKRYIPKGFNENIPYSLTNTTDLNAVSGLNIYKDSDGYVATALTTYIPDDDNYVGITTGHSDDEYFCDLSMQSVEDKASINNVSYIATSSSPQLVEDKKDFTIATMGWINKYYLSKEDYDKRFDTGTIILTAQGLNKIKALNDTPNQSIELHVSSDFLELMQLSGNKDLKLQIVYNGSLLYDNIVLHPNRTIEDYDNISSSSAKTIWYTGQAVITLSSQSDGLFDIAYSNGYLLGLNLITTF